MRFLSGNQRERTKGDSFPGNTIGQPERSQVTGARAGQSASHACPVAVLLTLVLIGIAAPIARAATIHVATTGSDGNDGLSWATAKQTVTAGLAAAASGDQVWVAAGTYVERITLKDGVALYGGFAGGETQLSERNWVANVAILDGNKGGSVVTVPAGATNAAQIDGFTIRNGLVDQSSGGGIYASNASPTITHNQITGNTAFCYGGGIYCTGAAPRIVDNVIAANTMNGLCDANAGAGIYCGPGSPMIANNTITANVNTGSAGKGGGIYCGAGAPIIRNNTIAGNIGGKSGGGLYCAGGAAITNNTVIGNTAYDKGGGVYCLGSATIVNNIVAFNASGICTEGTGIVTADHNCVFNPVGYDYSGLSAGAGDILADPQLLGAEYAEVHLRTTSPCIDAGLDASALPDWVDVDGQARIQATHVDIGADEFNGSTPQFAPAVTYVSTLGDDMQDGSSWSLAKRTIQAAIDAVATTGGDVWVAEGTYAGRITLRPWVHVYGGFSGDEEQRAERDWANHATVLPGGSGSVVTARSCSVCTVDGLVLRNGIGSLSGSSRSGGGVLCYNSLLRIANCTIVDNAVTAYGGGIYCIRAAPTIMSSTIAGNQAGWGGGVYCTSSQLTIANSVILRNRGSIVGGIYVDSDSKVKITNNTVTWNSARSGGGIGCTAGGIIANNIVAFNLPNGGVAPNNSLLVRGNCLYNPDGANGAITAPAGNLALDPQIVGAEYGQVHLAAGSPCIDAGGDEDAGLGWTDIDGQPRTHGDHVDIGADEFNGTPPAYAPTIVRVSPSGNDLNDGASWASAKQSIQAAVDTAAISGGEVWVAAGDYAQRVQMKSWTYLYGGFAGTEALREQRNWKLHTTTLDGQHQGSVISCAATGSIWGVDGLTIRNGKGTSLNGQTCGGGVFCQNTAARIANCVITANAASLGGGIYCDVSQVQICNNNIIGNGGGGVVCVDFAPLIANNTIVGNTGDYYGGGIGCVSSNPVIRNNIVAFNSSGLYSNGSPLVINNCFYNPAGLEGLTGDALGKNVFVNPELEALAWGRVHLSATSPCIDTGDDAVVPSGWVDVDGEPRIQGTHVDIGADEYNGAPPAPFEPVVVRVSSSGDDAHDGSSWSAAKRTFQAGIEAASRSGGEVWVAAGVYSERIILSPWAYVYGGFAGTESQREERRWWAQQTILQGDSLGSVVRAWAGYRVSGLDGLVVRRGIGDSVSPGGRKGGGINCTASPLISNSLVLGNTAAQGAGIYCTASAAPRIINTAIVGNVASSLGGGIDNASARTELVNCTLAANAAPSGAAVYYSNSRSSMTGCILWANTGATSLAGSSSDLLITYSDIQGGYAGTGNIDLDPQWVRAPSPGADETWGTDDDDYGDLRLRAGSPCIDAGSNAATTAAGLLVDLDGHGRFYNDPATPDCPWAPGTCGTAPIVDMGTYEFIAGDYDRDGDLDMADLAIFQACTSGPSVGYLSDCLKADLDHDGDVDAADFGILQRCYSGSDMPVAADCGN